MTALTKVWQGKAEHGWVEVHEVDGLVLDVLAEDDEVVAVVEKVLLHCGGILVRIVGEGNLLVWCGLGGGFAPDGAPFLL